jgi:hypothetical protein
MCHGIVFGVKRIIWHDAQKKPQPKPGQFLELFVRIIRLALEACVFIFRSVSVSEPAVNPGGSLQPISQDVACLCPARAQGQRGRHSWASTYR